MSWQWESNELSYSRSFCFDEQRNSPSYQRSKQLKAKPVKTLQRKPAVPASKRDANLEKIELFACKICDKKYTTKAGYSRHYTSAHQSGKDVNKIKKKTDNVASRDLCAWSSSTRFMCNYCGKELSSKASLDRHRATHRSPKPKSRQTKKAETATNINIFNTVNSTRHSTPNDFFGVVSNGFWN